MRRVVVAGAGVSGLTLARALRARGAEPLILESDARAGGKVRSEAAGGFLCEWGPTGFSGSDPAVAALVRELGLAERLVRAAPEAARRGVAVAGEVLPVPASPGALLGSRLLPIRARLRALGDLVLPRGPSARGEVESVAAFAARRLGAAAAERLVYPLISALYAADPEQVSLPDAFPRFAALERDHRSLLLGLVRTGRAATEGPGLTTFREGVEELTRTLAAEHTDRLHLQVALRRVEHRGGRFRLQLDDRGRTDELSADAVVLAIPAHAAAPTVAGLDAGLASALAAIPYVPVTLVHAGYPAAALARPLGGYGFFVPPAEPPRLLGAVFASSVFPGRAPEGHVLVSARVGGARRPTLAALPDHELVDLARAELGAILGIEQAPAFVRIVRHEQALPQYTLRHRERIAAVAAAERAHPGLFFAGNAYHGLGLADCIRNAAPLADRIAAHLRGLAAEAAGQ